MAGESGDLRGLNFAIGDLARLIRAEFERRIAEAGLPITPSEARVLAHVAHAGSARQNVLAERLGLAPMSLTGFLDRLEAAGLVARETDPDDRRAKRVVATAAAAEVLAATARIGAEIRAAARGGIDEADWRRFYETALAASGNLARARAEIADATRGAA
ncbi:MAG: MarR family transcriptional regulator [Rhodovulum sulfidophilum]|uniref:MarR family transcriptional regulator n=1 Tax=Rhodovulum sulfidophilum TaxID=35806 RepID=A0A2W5NCY2_RHOSU|nr:MAG: MarR family transcriptional regulator [Rhodovulum sulfidophilum]